MRKIILLISVCLPFFALAQTICGTANEGGSITLSAPAGYVFTSINFASYGTPNGSCGSFTIGGCHAANTVDICTNVFVGQNSATIAASNGVFGDPCGGTVKRLYIMATYSTILPIQLDQFDAERLDDEWTVLTWSGANEYNMSHFEVEVSINGIDFQQAAIVNATGITGHVYSYKHLRIGTEPYYYYRLKMVDNDGKSKTSKMVKCAGSMKSPGISIFPNPAADQVTITGLGAGKVSIYNAAGQAVSTFQSTGSTTTFDAGLLPEGIYLLRYMDQVKRMVIARNR